MSTAEDIIRQRQVEAETTAAIEQHRIKLQIDRELLPQLTELARLISLELDRLKWPDGIILAVYASANDREKELAAYGVRIHPNDQNNLKVHGYVCSDRAVYTRQKVGVPDHNYDSGGYIMERYYPAAFPPENHGVLVSMISCFAEELVRLRGK